ncbi:MAG: ankyrin repeat domain-containing protein [Opitutaceae bacterium]|nr:ankyrin repeat domain-containing protein [Opitutaceae bacterium]
MKSKVQIPQDIAQALTFVTEGKLFALQQWVAEGKRVQAGDFNDHRFCCLHRACERGFHSIVEVLLKVDGWSQEEKDSALTGAMHASRLDLVELLLAHGARVTAIDFEDLCRTLNIELMTRFLEAGVDPAADNAFARALDEFKARPLLRFYRDQVEKYPSLKGQISLALAEAVREKKTRWAALLVWAGADPFMTVPDELYGDWDFGEYGGRVAAEIACHSGEPDLVKVLKLRPDPQTRQELLSRVLWNPSAEIVRHLIKKVPASELNLGSRQSCKAVEDIVERRPWSFGYPSMSHTQQDDAVADCLEILLDAGARWNPDPGRLGSVRRDLIRNSSRYVVRILRLLLYVPGAADRALVAELCRTPVIQRKIYEGDRVLGKEIDELLAETRAGQR